MRPRVLFVQHEDDCPPGWFGEWLERSGVEPCVLLAHRGQALPERAAAYDGVIVLGGEMSAYDDQRCPWLPHTRHLIADAVASDLPFLGVCLGHQLAAVALGGVVEKNPAGTATGLTPVTPNATGLADVLLSSVRPGAEAIQWNEDVVTVLPDGAKPLATAADATVQAVRFAPHAWGVQFHPEVSPEIFDGWSLASPRPDQSLEEQRAVAAAATRIAAAGPALRTAWRPLAERFAAIVRASVPGQTRALAGR